MKFQRILVGIDFSHSCSQALTEAVRLASYDSTKVHLLHVVDKRVLESFGEEVVIDADRTINEAESRLADFIKEHAGGYQEIETEVVIGHPFAEFIRVINDTDIDLVVLGSAGTHDHPNKLGAIASKCLRKAPCALLVVDESQPKNFEKVVCAIDYSDTSADVVEYAIHIARLEQAALDFVHVYSPPSAFQDPESGVMLVGFEGIADYPRVVRENLESFVEPYLKDAGVNEVIYSVVDHMSVGRGIVSHLKEASNYLLVLGTHGRTGWRGLLLGTTAEHVFHKIPCSTLAVKPKDFHYHIPTI